MCALLKPNVRDVNDIEQRLHIVVEFESRKLPQEKLRLLCSGAVLVEVMIVAVATVTKVTDRIFQPTYFNVYLNVVICFSVHVGSVRFRKFTLSQIRQCLRKFFFSIYLAKSKVVSLSAKLIMSVSISL